MCLIFADIDDNVPISIALKTSPTAAMGISDKKEDVMSVDFPNESVRTIVRNIADLYDLNVVIPESLTGNASIKLKDVTWPQVFQVLLEPLGFSYTVEHNIVRIRGKAEMDQEPMEERVFCINYANLKDLKTTLTPFVDPKAGGVLQADERSNTLVVRERSAKIRQIQGIVAQLDQPTPQVMIESKFVELTDDDTKQLGVNWQSLSGYTLTASGGLSNGSQGQDVGNTGVPAGNISRVIGKVSQYTVDDAGNKSYAGSNFFRSDSAVLSASQFSVVLSALNTLNGTRVVSNPTVVTLNNVEANVTVATQYPFPQYSYNDQTGTFEVSGFDYKDIGISMKVLPQVNREGFITLSVKPELSTQTNQTVSFGGTSTGANAVALPIIDSRRTESIVTLKDGNTLAIGGLVSNQKGEVVSKVPLLGDIPILGLPFRSTKKTLLKRNLIIFITAKTLDPHGATYEEVVDPRLLYEMKVSPSEVPGYQVPKAEIDQMKAVQQAQDDLRRSELDVRLKQEKMALDMKAEKIKAGESTGPWQLEVINEIGEDKKF